MHTVTCVLTSLETLGCAELGLTARASPDAFAGAAAEKSPRPSLMGSGCWGLLTFVAVLLRHETWVPTHGHPHMGVLGAHTGVSTWVSTCLSQ